MASRPQFAADPPPRFYPPPDWVRRSLTDDSPDNAAFLAGAALAALQPIACSDHPIGRLWRQRLALVCAAVLVRQGGRTEDEATLRDHWYLTAAGDDPGPAGQVLGAWRGLGEPSALRAAEWPARLAALFDIEDGALLDAIVAVATASRKGQGSPVAAAAAVAAGCLRLAPGHRPLALWLADAVLAHRLNWPAPVPLIAGALKRGAMRHAAEQEEKEWQAVCALAWARAAAKAADRHHDLARRAERLVAVAPTLRGKDAAATVEVLLSEDAQAAKPGRATSDRSSRRLFDRLVALGAVRELTGRPTFRLYGL
jgi:hypothetical protein